MKKLIAVCAMALSMGAFADSYLYWMLGDSDDLDWGSDTAPATYTTAKIGVMNSSGNQVGYLNLYTVNGTAVTSGNGLSVSATPGDGSGAYCAGFGTYGDGYSYYIELLNDTITVGRSEILTYSALDKYIANGIGSSSMPATPWSPTSFTTAVIPEPTSGLLMLFGLSALALRRKRKVKA